LKPTWAKINRRDIGLALLVTVVAAVLLILGWMRPVERPLSDLLLRTAGHLSSASSPVSAVVIDDRSVEAVGPLPWARDDLATLVGRIAEHEPRVLIIDMLFPEERTPDGDALLEAELAKLDTILVAVLSPDGGWLLPIDRFGGAAAAAHGHAETDTDGVVRCISTTKQANGLALPALALVAAQRAGWSRPIAPGRRIFPDFRQAPEDIPQISAADLLADSAKRPELITDRLVFLGYSASGTTDQYLVPVGKRNHPIPGVLVHAAATSSALQGGLLRPLPTWAAIALAFLVAWATQSLRSSSGRFRLLHICAVSCAVVLTAVGALWLANVLIPAFALIVAASLSTGMREAVESKQAQAETGAILSSLIEEEGVQSSVRVPRGVHGRLAQVKNLQGSLSRDRNLRRTLLEGMNEGVALWDHTGSPLLINRALLDLWGHQPLLKEAQAALAEADESPAIIQRGQRCLEVEIVELGEGSLGLFRDVTVRAELDLRRREMHRLVSHELKTPLASISGFGEMLQTYEMSGEELHNVAGRISAEADRLGEMVRVFLDIERLGTGHWESERTELDLAAIVESRRQILASAAATRDQSIEVDTSSCSPIQGVEQLISQMIDNLIGNALKYSPDGGAVHLVIGPDGDGNVRLAVRDHGSGIPEQAVPQLFERFYRVPGTKAQGTGLGLALVKEVADWHCASIEVDTQVGEGSCFTVLFPVSGEKEW